ncbi:mitochondrial inner membrane protease ATP23 homolog [Osmia lignaria lignaria]|uniref:mitochondrial inner membrane protease ATP23 homolog n=1 Tax=Osmia lignaria lignaria TaxID=1437193 RepID=UPI0014797821|nr:mitochondrial inner membrane protease ATP23 homolog [Osmia lignaria]
MTGKSDEESIPAKNNNTEADYSDLYPGRKNASSPESWISKIPFFRSESFDKIKCETNVYSCLKDSPLIKLMVAALKSSGCEIDIGRHISCEICDERVTGGYDQALNQIIVCQNTATSKNRVQSTLGHEMIHMFDCCRNNVELNNIKHLACTEIRAANLCHCSFLGAFARQTASPFNIKKAHQRCVQDKAVRSVVAIKNVSQDVAKEAVMQVFDKCYNDLEPVGRRIRRNSLDMKKAYLEGPLYGYTE